MHDNVGTALDFTERGKVQIQMINNMLVSLDPGMDGCESNTTSVTSPEGVDHLTRPDVQPVVGLLFKGLDLNDYSHKCSASKDPVHGPSSRGEQSKDCEVVEH